MRFDDEPQPRGRRNLLISILIILAVVLMLALHLTGIVEPGSR